jgi:hypothetical protein
VRAAETLAMAQNLLDSAEAKTAGLWPRAAAVLARQALEQALDEHWQKKGLPLERLPTHAQLICLPEYLDDRRLAASVRHAWNVLSEACHHHPYELAPTTAELRQWMSVTESFLRVLA